MKKSIFSLTAALLLSSTLVGCGTNNNAANRNNAGVRPIGYNTNNGDGLGYNNRLNNNVGMGNNNGRTIQGSTAANQRQARAIAARVSRLNNVNNVSVVVTNRDVLVGVQTNNTNTTTTNQKNAIRNTVQGIVKGKNVHVTTDPTMYNRIQNVSNNLQNGNAGNEVSSDITGIINDLANAVKRPFQNNVPNNR